MSASRAVGLDEVPLQAVRECFSVIGPHLLKLINLSLATKVFPDKWKTACVVPIPKSGDPAVPSNNRPISLLSVLSKILEKVVCTQLVEYLNANVLLHPSQYAYRPRHSTEDAVLAATERLVTNTDSGFISSVTAVDLSKAFDSIDHDVLLTKLSWYGIADVDWFRSYLSDRKQIVRGGKLTLPMTCGVPQGSILGPILFILFTNDLYGFLTYGRLISYADDTIHMDCAPPDERSLACLKARLELTMCELQSWFSANSLKMNEKKTAFMLVGSKQKLKNVTDFHLHVSGATVKASGSIKMLGVIVDSGLSWSAHVSSVVKRCNAILISLYRCRHYFTSDILKIIIQAYVFPHITYCLCVWGGTTKIQLHKIQKTINFAARIITGNKKHNSISPALNSLGWPRIEVMVAHRDVIKVFRTLMDAESPHDIRALLVPRSAVSARETRTTQRGNLQLSRHRLTSTQRTFSYRAAAAWNRLPTCVITSTSLNAFKTALRDI